MTERRNSKTGRSAAGRVALVVAALAITALVVPGPAQAETAKEKELESRIERLENLVTGLASDLKQARRETKEAKEQAAKAAAIPPKVARSGKAGVSLTVSGQVNRGVLIADDGHDTEVFHVDNDHSSSRVRFVGKGAVDKDLEVGAEIEVQIESNSTAAVNQINPNTGTQGFTERKIEVYAKHKKFGKLTIGQGPTASDGTSELDLTGTNLIIKSNQGEFAGGLLFRFENTPNANSPNQTLTPANPTIGGSFSNMDGLSRLDRARYDTPSVYGFTLSGSAASEGAYDGALRYAGKHGPVKLTTAIAAANDPVGANDRNQFSGSGSVLHEPTGLGFTAAAGCRDGFAKDRGCNDRRFWYVKGGWQWDVFDFGRTHLGIDYYKGRGISQNGERSDAIGAGIVQHIDKVATEIYLGVRNYSLSRTGGAANGNFDDIIAVLTGARIKF